MTEPLEPQADGTQERRKEPRFESAMPLQVDGTRAKLTDLSASGIGFVSKVPVEPGTTVAIGVRHLPDDVHPLPCTAEIVRVEPGDKGFAVGARLQQPREA